MPPCPASNRRRWRNIAREKGKRDRTSTTVVLSTFLWPYMVVNHAGMGGGYCLAVSQPCDLETGSVMVQKRRTGSEERKSDSLGAVELCLSTLSTSDRDVVHPLLAHTAKAGFSIYAGTPTHSIAWFAGHTGLG